ncbi:MAG: RimK-like ATPgrasp N-terminal domain-containing protein [Candidatus Zixiibacteriota bacterium]|nr:MAG: RimK-like ATPgrasp N-terminal domain-containing protein [candidate division Zixibacteria bacterium]
MTKRDANSRAASELLQVARRHGFVGRLADYDGYVNLAGDYDYLSQAYYVSQDRLLSGELIVPSCQDMLDAYVSPLFLEKARLAGLPVPEYYISNGYIEPPVIVDPVNPFTLKGKVVLKASRAKSIAKSLTRNFTYAICCQELPEGSQVAYFKAVLGWCVGDEYREMARVIWDVFKIPLARIRVIKLADGGILLSDIAPLPFTELGKREMEYIKERVVWGS